MAGALASSGASYPIAVAPAEAARRLGIGRTTFYRLVLPELRVVRLPRRTLVPVAELDRWLRENAAKLAG